MIEHLIFRFSCLLVLIFLVTCNLSPRQFNSDEEVIIPDESDSCSGHHHHQLDDEEARSQGYEPWDEHMAKERIKAKFRARTATDPTLRKSSEIEDEDELLDKMIEAHKLRSNRRGRKAIGRRRNAYWTGEEEAMDTPGLFRRISRRFFRWWRNETLHPHQAQV